MDLQKKIVGISFVEGEKPQSIRLWFNHLQAPYIKTKPLHPGQKIVEETQSGIVISLNLVLNFELEQLILSYGERVKVLEPDSLAEKIASRIKASAENYK